MLSNHPIDMPVAKPQFALIDLHGLSVGQAKHTVQYWLMSASQANVSKIRFVTGRGNHRNARGEYGTLFKQFTTWVEEAKLEHRIAKIERHDGFYEVHFHSTASTTKVNTLYEEMMDEFLEQDKEHIKKQAELGDPYFQNLYASLLEEGKHVPQDFKQAFYFFMESAKQNYSMAIHQVARCYLHGLGTRQSDQKAFEWLKKGDELNFAQSTLSLGDCYCSGLGTQRNPAAGIECYRKAAHLGEPTAMRKLGFAYKEGACIEKNAKLAIYWYQKSADAGDATAQYNMGIYFQKGYLVTADQAQALHYFNLSAENGDPDAQFEVGNYYWVGRYVQRDPHQAMKWLKRAADHQSVKANRLLSKIADPDERSIYLKRAAQLGDVLCDFNLKLAENKELLDKDPHKKDELLEQIIQTHAKHLDINQIPLLEVDSRYLLIDGMLTSKKVMYHKKAVFILMLMAQENCIFSLRRLFYIHFNGIAVPKDINAAIGFLKQAVDNEDSPSMVLWGRFHEDGLYGLPISEQVAFNVYQKASRLEHPHAFYHLGIFFELGKGTPKDIQKAYQCYIKAMSLEKDKKILEDLDIGLLDKYKNIGSEADKRAKNLIQQSGSLLQTAEFLSLKSTSSIFHPSESAINPHPIKDKDEKTHVETNSGKSSLNLALSFKEMGNAAFKSGQLTKAIEYYTLALNNDRLLKEAYFNRGLTHLKLNELESAEMDFSIAIRIDPMYTKAIYQKISLLISIGKLDLALKTIESYRSQNGTDPSILDFQKKCIPCQSSSVSETTSNPTNLDQCSEEEEFEYSLLLPRLCRLM